MLDTILFYSFALLTLVGAILTVSLAGVAGLFLLQKAEFLFAVQIVLYIGGITVLFLFVIMLVNLDQTAHQPRYHRHWLVPLAATAGVGALFVAFLTRGRDLLALPAPRQAEAGGNVEQLADMLFRDYLVPFEVASLLLLVAIVGSVMMARKKV
jgi:NADH-quinone oxidoreductase subunit J